MKLTYAEAAKQFGDAAKKKNIFLVILVVIFSVIVAAFWEAFKADQKRPIILRHNGKFIDEQGNHVNGNGDLAPGHRDYSYDSGEY